MGKTERLFAVVQDWLREEEVPRNVTVQVVGAVLRSEGTACALRCDRMALPR
jgi:hypothetical protein